MVGPVFPFTAIVGQDEMKLALLLNVIDPSLGGVLIMGHRGTGKSTAVRALAQLQPKIWVVRDCRFRCDPSDAKNLCNECLAKQAAGEKLTRERARVAVVDLPLGATEDRVCGTIDIERALRDAKKSFEPGLLARANRGFLYIDEVNLLEDHLVDLLLDVAVTGVSQVEREGISIQHPARFVLAGSGNPEEGELRPQLLDRFGLHVEVTTENDLDQRIEIVERHELFVAAPDKLLARFQDEQEQLQRKLVRGQSIFNSVTIDRSLLRKIAELCVELRLDGHRGELTLTRASRALAALNGRRKVVEADVEQVTLICLRHRLRRDAFDETASAERIRQAWSKVLAGEGAAEQRDDDWTTSRAREREGSSQTVQLPPTKASDVSKVDLTLPNGTGQRKPSSGRRKRSQAKAKLNSDRGRYAMATNKMTQGGRVAVDATLRAYAIKAKQLEGSNFPTDALRYKQFKKKSGSLFIFAIDTSGSMAPVRIQRARQVILGLLKRAYLERDSIAIVAFRGQAAAVVLPPSRSILRAKRVLDGLTIGGGTPLSAGIASAIDVAKLASGRERNTRLLVFTDGNANVPLRASEGSNRREVIARELAALGKSLRDLHVTTVVVETQNRFTSKGGPQQIAQYLGVECVRLTVV